MKILTLEHRNIIRAGYEAYMPQILNGEYVDPYSIFPFNIVEYMSPIERNVWGYYRETNQLMYPQVPCGRYFIDFAYPPTGLAIEVDGAEWHKDIEHDMKRQEYIMSRGYNDFRRIEGKYTYDLEHEDDEYGFDF